MDGHPIREDLPFYQYAEEWYTLKKEPFISDASRSAYRTMFNKHLLPAFGLRHLRAISAGEIQAFINSFADSSKSQITLAMGTLKALFASAYAEGIIERDPSVSIIRPKAKKKTERRALTDQETENVLHTIQNHEHGLFLQCFTISACGAARRWAYNGVTSILMKIWCISSATLITLAPRHMMVH